MTVPNILQNYVLIPLGAPPYYSVAVRRSFRRLVAGGLDSKPENDNKISTASSSVGSPRCFGEGCSNRRPLKYACSDCVPGVRGGEGNDDIGDIGEYPSV